jgi:hypothetical protein
VTIERLFEGDAHVDVQGERNVLRVRDVDEHWIEFQVIGFDDCAVSLIDYRPATLAVINAGLADVDCGDGEIPTIAAIDVINRPARVRITRYDGALLVISLMPTDDPDPAHRLWIPIGIEDLPVYDVVVEHLEPLDDGTTAALLLYRRYDDEED